MIFLDEPTTGLDLRAAGGVASSGLAETGMTIFLTTQYLEEADQLADRIAILDGGRIVAEGTSADLKRRVAGQRLDLLLADPPAFEDAAHLLGGRAVQRDPKRLTIGVATDGSAAHVRALLDEVDPTRGAVERFAVHSATLDDVFLALTGRPADRPGTEGTRTRRSPPVSELTASPTAAPRCRCLRGRWPPSPGAVAISGRSLRMARRNMDLRPRCCSRS